MTRRDWISLTAFGTSAFLLGYGVGVRQAMTILWKCVRTIEYITPGLNI